MSSPPRFVPYKPKTLAERRALNSSDESGSSGTSGTSTTTVSGDGKTSIVSIELERDRATKIPSSNDGRYENPVRNYPIRPDHPLVPVWEAQIEPALMAVMASFLRWWLAVDVLRRGHHNREEDNPIIIVVVIRKDTPDPVPTTLWEELTTITKESQNSGERLEVEVMKGSLRLSARSRSNEYTSVTRLGCSVGPSGVEETGTGGGCVKLEEDGATIGTFLMTCHHVVVNAQDPSHQEIFKEGIQPTTKGPHLIMGPSDPDHKATVISEEDALQVLATLTSEIQEKINAGFASETTLTNLNFAQSRLEQAEARTSSVRSFDRRIGAVYHSSGFRVAKTGCSLDWALIKLREGREGLNEILPSDYPDFIANARNVTGTVGFEIGNKAFKWGTVSGNTLGTFNAIRSNINIEYSTKATREWCFVGESFQNWFSRDGDSGAWALSRNGVLGGLVFAASDSGSSYVTPVKTLFEDIEDVTGCKVVLP